jgi:hypothetical protein
MKATLGIFVTANAISIGFTALGTGVGSLICPGVGTIVGTFLGAIAGFYITSK